MTVVR